MMKFWLGKRRDFVKRAEPFLGNRLVSKLALVAVMKDPTDNPIQVFFSDTD